MVLFIYGFVYGFVVVFTVYLLIGRLFIILSVS